MKAILKRITDKGQVNNPGWQGVFDVTSDLTGSVLGLYTMRYEAGSKGADPHYHKKMMEIFNVLEGAVSILVNGQWEVLEQGETAIIPVLTVHAFRPLPDRGCKLQILFTPNIKREEFFMDFHKYAKTSDQEKYEFWAKYDQYPPETLNEC